MKQRFIKILQSVEEIGLALFCLIILRSIMTKTVDESEFTVNLFFWLSRLIELMACVITWNHVASSYYKVALPACTIALMSFINECLHLFGVVALNNVYLLGLEFLILLFVLWRTSKI